MPDGRFAIIDPAAGISGDMLLGALVALGAPREWLAGLPARLGFPDVTIRIDPVMRNGLAATKVTVRLPGGEIEGPSADFAPSHHHHHDGDHHPDHHQDHEPHGHGHVHGPHRHVGELLEVVRRAPLSSWVRERALRAFELLGEAEGRVHGLPAEQVALHEVGAVDAVIDIVGAIEGFEQLGITRIYAWPAALGSGWVQASHGTIPVPAPATALLMEGLEIGPNGPVTGEATTPTGAVLLRVLSQGEPPRRWRPAVTGWGAGTRDPAHYANVLRVIVAEAAAEMADVVVLAMDVDDLSPEYLEPLREAAVAAGALDVQVWATQAKKGRTGFRVEAMAGPAEADAVADALFRHSTTAGLRRWRAERTTLARRQITLDVGGGVTVRVKLLETPDGLRAKPEFEDVAAAARATGRPAHEMARELAARALDLMTAKES